VASLVEIFDIVSFATTGATDLRNQVASAVLITAEAIRVESTATTKYTSRQVWAKEAFQNPLAKTEEMFPQLIAANNTATVSQILGANETTIKNNVAASVNIFADSTGGIGL
jgi:hypothetical protein